jgi:hypothetical protein
VVTGAGPELEVQAASAVTSTTGSIAFSHRSIIRLISYSLLSTFAGLIKQAF